MTTEPEQITAWRATDGSMFESKEGAFGHNKWLAETRLFKEALEEYNEEPFLYNEEGRALNLADIIRWLARSPKILAYIYQQFEPL